MGQNFKLFCVEKKGRHCDTDVERTVGAIILITIESIKIVLTSRTFSPPESSPDECLQEHNIMMRTL
jgi:hypothetical protein